jgi:hypothetical protein
MTLQEETKCIATPGFAGFVPSLKYQFGLTYGNATRQILRTDPSLKKGFIQTELSRKTRQTKAPTTSSVTENHEQADEKGWVWKVGRNKYATGDDRFSFPPVPGYTGYIPRSQEHFGRPYVETTNASLASFQAMLKSKNQLPARIQAIKDRQAPGIAQAQNGTSSSSNALSNNNNATASLLASSTANQESNTLPAAYRSIENNQKTFISGYTGYVPRLQNYFGEPYSESVRKAIDDFSVPKPPRNPYLADAVKKSPKSRQFKLVKTTPIPGFTGYIPGSRTCYSTTFGKTSEIAYDNFNHRDEKGRMPQALTSTLPNKDLAKTLPIPGYRGHIPSFIYSAERSYGISSKDCISHFNTMKEDEKRSLKA